MLEHNGRGPYGVVFWCRSAPLTLVLFGGLCLTGLAIYCALEPQGGQLLHGFWLVFGQILFSPLNVAIESLGEPTRSDLLGDIHKYGGWIVQVASAGWSVFTHFQRRR